MTQPSSKTIVDQTFYLAKIHSTIYTSALLAKASAVFVLIKLFISSKWSVKSEKIKIKIKT